MLDIKFVRENPEVVKQNIRNKFQDSKLELVDKVLELDKENREIKQEVEALRAERNKISKQIGALMGQGKREEAEEVKKQVAASGTRIEELSQREKEVEEELLKDMMVIPNPTCDFGFPKCQCRFKKKRGIEHSRIRFFVVFIINQYLCFFNRKCIFLLIFII